MKEEFPEAIEAFGENVYERVTKPASIQLFVVNKKAQQIDEEKGEIFHSVVAKLLYIIGGSRPDLETAISLLCQRVSKSNVGD